MLNKFYFNGHWSDEFGIKIETPPTIVKPARKFQSSSVMGRNGNIYQFQNAYGEVIVSYKINAGSSVRNVNQTVFTSIVEWLNGADDYSVLKDTYDTTHYRMAVFVDPLDIDNLRTMYGKATINFRCRPEYYIVTPSISIQNGSVVANSTNHIAKPVITLTGGGAKSLIGLNNKVVDSPVREGLYQSLSSFVTTWDTSAWVCSAFSKDAISFVDSTPFTVNLIGSEGLVEITPSNASQTNYGVGLIQEVQADSDYTFSCEADCDLVKEAGVTVYFVGATGKNNILGYVSKLVTVSDEWKSIVVPFHTPSECRYIAVVMQRLEDTRLVKRSFRHIMLNGGKTAKPFQPYDESNVSHFTVNDTTLEFTVDGFDTAVIDCENEHFIIDGVNANRNSSIVDQYGNLSEQYLLLNTGNNLITFDGDIEAVSIEPKFWEL